MKKKKNRSINSKASIQMSKNKKMIKSKMISSSKVMIKSKITKKSKLKTNQRMRSKIYYPSVKVNTTMNRSSQRNKRNNLTMRMNSSSNKKKKLKIMRLRWMLKITLSRNIVRLGNFIQLEQKRILEEML